MNRLRLMALGLGLLALAACSHGLQLQDGERPIQPVARISFLFSEGQNDIVVDVPDLPSPPQSPAPAQMSPPVAVPTGTQSPQTPPAGGAASTQPSAAPASETSEAAPSPEPTPLPEVDIAAITANDAATSLAIPASEVDPGLEVIDEATDPSEFLSEQLMAESGLVSFYVTGSSRQPSGGTDAGRPVQLVQRLFVHSSEQGASRLFQELVDSAAPTFAIAALGFFRQFYPDLEPTTRASDQFPLADENRLIEIRIDPKIEPEERELGPGDPHVYYLILRQGKVAALFELVYLSPQEPGTVTVLGERLINRIPSDLAEPQPASA